MKKIAVILCGSGYKDGSEIRESVGVLWALSQEKAQVEMYALNEMQSDVVNCLTGEPVQEKRNQLVEAARIARGKVKPLTELKADAYQALILPGGFGAAKNLCTFASQGSQGKVNAVVSQVLHSFHSQKKPIGAVCIAPAILALAFPKAGFELTLGPECEDAQEVEKLRHKTFVCSAGQWHTDTGNKIVTSPAYMHDDAELRDVFSGIQGLVKEVLRLA